MILLLNYLPYIIIALGVFLCWRSAKKHRGTDKVGKRVVLWAGLTLLALFVFKGVTLTYVGKPVGEKLAVPTVEDLAVKAEEAPPIEDKLLKPSKTPEESKRDTARLVDWRAARAERESAHKASDAPVESKPLPLP